jgi:Flp pilus assembly protein RcpC/CpaB
MSIRPAITFRTVLVMVIVFACGLAGSLLTPRFRAAPPAEQPTGPGAASQRQPPDSAGHARPGNRTQELAIHLAEGFRAVSVQVPPGPVVKGSVLPLRRVDVAWVPREECDDEEAIILQNVLVLAVDSCRSDKPWAPMTVTLGVRPKQAEKLIRATERGTLRLIVVEDDDEIGAGSPPDGQ